MASMKRFFILILSIFFFSCASRLPTPTGVPEISVSDYEDLVAEKTMKMEVYDGLHNKLTISATWLDSRLAEATLSHSARLAQWTEQKFKEERSKKINKNAESTEFFVSVYTPERKHNDLSPNKNLWKIYLDVNGQRYEGKAAKMRSLLSEVQALYPQHTRWSTPYIVSFPVATGLVENKSAVLTLTGAVGSVQLKY